MRRVMRRVISETRRDATVGGPHRGRVELLQAHLVESARPMRWEGLTGLWTSTTVRVSK